MTTPQLPEPRRITEADQPVFPCWLYRPDTWEPRYYGICRYWFRESVDYSAAYLTENGCTFWLPDQPTAPTCVPEPRTPDDLQAAVEQPDQWAKDTIKSILSYMPGVYSEEWVNILARDLCTREAGLRAELAAAKAEVERLKQLNDEFISVIKWAKEHTAEGLDLMRSANAETDGLQADLADLRRQLDESVPRSRYNAANSDWLESKKKYAELLASAIVQLTAATQRADEAEKDRETAQKLLMAAVPNLAVQPFAAMLLSDINCFLQARTAT